MFGPYTRTGMGTEAFPVLLPRMRYRRRNYSRARTVHSLRNGTFRIRQCQHRIFRHSHGRISQYDDYRRSFRSRLCHLAGIRYAVPPTSPLFIFPLPFPIKAKYFVIGYALIELFSGLANNPGDNVAHFAHLGGMIFGFILIMYWRKKNRGNGYYYN